MLANARSHLANYGTNLSYIFVYPFLYCLMVIYLAIIDESRNCKKLPDMLALLGDKSPPTTSLTVMSDFCLIFF